MNIAGICNVIPPFFRRHKLVRALLLFSPGSKNQLVEFNGGAKLYADISDPFPRSYFLGRAFEPEFFSIAMPFLSRGGIFFDIGANFGFCTFGLAHALHGKKVEYHLFEANREACDLLRRSVEFYQGRKAVINNCAVSDRPGISRLLLKKGHLSGSYISGKGSQEVSNLCLDDYIRSSGITRIDFMKMDIEGAEPLALRGAEKSLRAGVIKILYLEISCETLSRFGFTEADCLAFLKEAGFSLFHVKDVDFQKGIADTKAAFNLNVNGVPLRLSPVKKDLGSHETDILAIHASSEYWKEKNNGT